MKKREQRSAVSGAAAAVCLAVALGCLQAAGAHVQITAQDFMGQGVTNQALVLTPLSWQQAIPSGAPTILVTRTPLRTNTGPAGTIVVSNVLSGLYDLSFGGPFSVNYRILVPDTNALVNAATLTTSLTGTNAPAGTSWSASVSDLRYASLFGSNLVVWTNGGRLMVAAAASGSGSGSLTVSTNGTTVGTVATAGTLTVATNGTTVGTITL